MTKQNSLIVIKLPVSTIFQDATPREVAANLPDSEKVNRLQHALDGHARLHADMKKENEKWQHEIAELRREKAQELMAQSQEIQALKQSIEEKKQEIQEKAQAIEDYHSKVEQRDRQLDSLKKPLNEAELSPKAMEEYDKYFEHVLKLTEALTSAEATVRKQEQELDKLGKLIKRAEQMEEQAAQSAVELSKKEHQQATLPWNVAELKNEVDRLQQFEDVQLLKAQLHEAQDKVHEQEMVQHQLQQNVENLSATNVQLQKRLQEEQEHKSNLEHKLEEEIGVKTIKLNELELLKEEIGELQLRLRQREINTGKVQGTTKIDIHVKSEAEWLDEVRALEEKLQDRDEELKKLRHQAVGSLAPVQTSLKYADLPPGTDPMVEIATLKQALESKEHKIESLQVQVRSFEDVIKHTKEQSKQVLKLKQELKTVQVSCNSITGCPIL